MANQVNYRTWFFRVITWDGLLPACILLAPTVAELLLPHNRGLIEFMAVATPIVAFFARIRAGKHHIASNHCTRVVRAIQFCVFCLGLFPLVLIDAVVILSHVMPAGALFAAKEDRIVFVALVSIYLAAMLIAMYPGRAEAIADV